MSPVQNPPHSEQRVAGSLPRCWPYTPTFDIARQPSSIWARQGWACKRARSNPGCCSQHAFFSSMEPKLPPTKHLRHSVALNLLGTLFSLGSVWLGWKGRVVGWPGGASQAGGGGSLALPASPGTSYRPKSSLPATLHCLLLLLRTTFRPVTRTCPTPPGHTPSHDRGNPRANEL